MSRFSALRQPNFIDSHAKQFLCAIIALFIALGIFYSIATPIFETPDEGWHFAYVRELATHHQFPVVDPEGKQPYRHEGLQPPLYYTLGSVFIAWMSENDLTNVPAANPYARIGDPRFASNDNRNAFLHAPTEDFPFRGVSLAVHLLRWYSILLGAVTIACTFALAQEIFPQQPIIALGAAAFVAFLPQFIFISSAISNDNLATALTVATLWQLARITRRGLTNVRIAILGLLVGAALLTKLNTLALTPLVLIALAYVALQKRDWRTAIFSGAIIGGMVAVIAGGWYLRNYFLYGDLTTFGILAQLVGERSHALSFWRWLSAESEGLRLSMWGVFGWFNIRAAPWFYNFFDALGLLGLAGIVIATVTRRNLSMLLAMLALWCVLIFVALWGYASIIITSQGRLLFPALPAWAILWSWGIAALLPSRARSLAILGLGGAQAIIAVIVPLQFIAPAYTPAFIANETLPQNTTKLDWRFDNGVEWLGASVNRTTVSPGDEIRVTIYARVPAGVIAQNAIFIHVVNSAGVIVAQRDSYIGSGNLPAQSSPIVIADSYAIQIPVTVPAPDEWQVQVGMYDPITGKRADAVDRSGRALSSNLPLAQLSARPANADAWNFDFDGSAILDGIAFKQNAVAPDQSLILVLHWRPRPPGSQNNQVFVHALGANERVWAAADVPLDTSRPMQIDLRFDPQTPPGIYPLELGIYPAPNGSRYAVFDRRGQSLEDRLFLGPIRVLER